MYDKTDRKALFLEKLSEGKGIIQYAVDNTGICRQTYYNWLEDDPDFKKAVEDINENVLDLVESKLLTAINDENLTAIIFYLKTKGKKRGYVEQVDNNIIGNAFENLMKSVPDDGE